MLNSLYKQIHTLAVGSVLAISTVSMAASAMASSTAHTTIDASSSQDNQKEQKIERQYQERGIYMDPVTAAFIAKLEANPPAKPPTAQEDRQGLDDLQSDFKMPEDMVVEDRVLPIGPTGKTSIRIYYKRGIWTPAPALVYFHGGGFTKGGVIAHGRMVTELASCSDAIVIFVNYDLAPESKYPIAHEQCYEVLKYVAAHPYDFSTKADIISVGGDSVGGAIAATCAMRAKEQGGPSIRSVLLFYPAVELDAKAIEYGKLRNGPLLTKEGLDTAWSSYFGPSVDLAAPNVSPVRASVDQLKNMPPTLIITAQNDVLHTTGEQFADKLIAAKVDVTASRYLGTIHDFMMLNPLKDTPASQAAFAEACYFLNNISK